MYLRPSEIFYTQDSISCCFDRNSNHCGVRIGETLDRICENRCSIFLIPKISVLHRDGKWVSADNRRLWVYKQLERLGKCTQIQVRETTYIPASKFTSCDEGNSIYVRGDPGGQWHRKPSIYEPVRAKSVSSIGQYGKNMYENNKQIYNRNVSLGFDNNIKTNSNSSVTNLEAKQVDSITNFENEAFENDEDTDNNNYIKNLQLIDSSNSSGSRDINDNVADVNSNNSIESDSDVKIDNETLDTVKVKCIELQIGSCDGEVNQESVDGSAGSNNSNFATTQCNIEIPSNNVLCVQNNNDNNNIFLSDPVYDQKQHQIESGKLDCTEDKCTVVNVIPSVGGNIEESRSSTTYKIYKKKSNVRCVLITFALVLLVVLLLLLHFVFKKF